MLTPNRNIDALKYLMSIMIIMIHIGYSLEFPILRAAVPVFFIISSYFFFLKINKAEDKREKNDILVKFVKRALKLYLFWFIVLLPVTVFARKWYTEDLATIALNLVRGFTIGSTFLASWYITAYIIGIALIYKFRAHRVIIGVVSIGCYILCTLASNYYYLFDSQFIRWLGEYYIFNSFPVGLIYIYIGMILAEKPFMNDHKSTVLKCGIVGMIAGVILLYTEDYVIVKYALRQTDDCYFSLLILSPSIFVFCNSLPHFLKFDTKLLRKMSTIDYCSHFSIITVLIVIAGLLHIQVEKFQLLTITFALVTLLSIILISMQKYRPYKWLKYSY